MRFISQDDPVFSNAQGAPVDSNLYAYCLNNPVMYSDFNGHMAGTAVLGGLWIFGGSNSWNPLGWIILGFVAVVSCVAIGIRAGKAISQIKANKRTKIPSGIKTGNRVKTPKSHPGEFTKNKDGTYTHKKTKWRIGKAKDGHYGGDHWHIAPNNAKTGDYYNIGPDGTILS